MTTSQGIIQLATLWIEFSAIVVLSLTLFRFPLSLYKTKIAIISLVMALISFYVRNVMEMFNYSVLLVIISYVALTVVLMRLPLLYSMLVCITGYFAQAVVQVALGISGMQLGITSIEQIDSSIWHGIVLSLATAAVSYGLCLLLQARKIGFMFIARRFQGKDAMRGYNFILAAILLLLGVTIQLGVLSFKIGSVHLYLIAGMLILFLIAVTAAFQHNRQLLKDKYKRL
jgi:hypothetical protein